jgi:hypothetical protein
MESASTTRTETTNVRRIATGNHHLTVRDVKAFIALCDAKGIPNDIEIVIERNVIGVPGDIGIRCWWTRTLDSEVQK